MRARRLVLPVLAAAAGAILLSLLLRRHDSFTGPETTPAAPAPGGAGSAVPPGTSAARPEAAVASIAGTVRYRGRPAAATVAVWSSWPLPSCAAAVECEGEFAVRGLAAGGWHLVAEDGEGRRSGTFVVLDCAGAEKTVDLDLPPAAVWISGRVTWSDGRPFAGALVVEPPDGGKYFFVLLDGEGRFRVAAPSAGAGRIAALDPGRFQGEWRPVAWPAEDEILLVADGGLRSVTGRVLAEADGSPPAGAVVRFGGGAAGCAATDPAGRFALLVPPRTVTLLASAPGYAELHRDLPPEAAEVELRLTRPGSVAGVVRCAGSPVGGAVVVAIDRDRRAVTGADGRYLLDGLPAGTEQVAVAGGGFVSPGLADFVPGEYEPLGVRIEPGRTVEHDLEVVPAAAVTGRVTDADGGPVRGAAVSLRAAPRRTFDASWDRWRFDGDERSAPGLFAATDASGAFRIAPVVPGMLFHLSVTTPGDFELSPGPFRLEPGEERRIDVQVPPCRPVTVRVRDRESGAPVEGATVKLTVELRGPRWDWLYLSRLSDPAGAATFAGVPPGDRSAKIRCAGYADREVDFGLDGEGSEVDVDLRPSREEPPEASDGPPPEVPTAGARSSDPPADGDLGIRGRVLGPDGEPVAGVAVRAYPTRRLGARGGGRDAGPTSRTGEFEFADLGAGEWTLEASAPPGLVPGEALKVPAGAGEVEIRLARGRSVTVTVLGPGDRPLPGARITLHHPGSEWIGSGEDVLALATAGPDGRAALSAVPEDGAFGLAVRPPRDGDWEPLSIEEQGWTPRDETFRFRASFSVRGRVVDRAGRPVPGAALAA